MAIMHTGSEMLWPVSNRKQPKQKHTNMNRLEQYNNPDKDPVPSLDPTIKNFSGVQSVKSEKEANEYMKNHPGTERIDVIGRPGGARFIAFIDGKPKPIGPEWCCKHHAILALHRLGLMAQFMPKPSVIDLIMKADEKTLLEGGTLSDTSDEEWIALANKTPIGTNPSLINPVDPSTIPIKFNRLDGCNN